MSRANLQILSEHQLLGTQQEKLTLGAKAAPLLTFDPFWQPPPRQRGQSYREMLKAEG
jgi:hypothetical protein